MKTQLLRFFLFMTYIRPFIFTFMAYSPPYVSINGMKMIFVAYKVASKHHRNFSV